ncbi:protein phosphatase 2C domain-containing protein [Corynebacterium sp. TA-R-1]|uniref:Protein phosphatase 2C domain-containing protein n=1 Tax=Corynebacterium stercoris TaxID=2943490 RepID=A0ABT1G247_9CORY|nr:protein phosphatase 2C domain-containing protein [Corynebacterium stercoris]MCP1388105.1 protein phosphatase 2C domain-containing protein [Corynebacterium stercoris]
MTENTQQLHLNFVAASDRGLVRGNNEDSAYAGPHLLALADGMGGHAAGEIASQLMVTHLEHLDKSPGDADLLALLGAAAEDANAAIEDSVAEHPEQQGMGTTLTALMFNGTQFGMIHVGDSRGYLLRDGALTQLTVDDTFVQSLVDEGKLNPEDVSSHPQKSLILKAYTGRPVEPHLEMVEAKAGDRILLCSDGLSDPVTNETIAVALDQGTPEIAAQRLIELALRSGGPDNITVVVADVVAGAASASEESSAPAIVGALAPGYESTHPNSSASRAAALLRKSETIQPDHNRTKTQPADAAEGAADDAEGPQRPQRPRRTVWPWVVGCLLLAIILVFAGVMWVRNKTTDLYFLNVDQDGAFVIEHGSKQKREEIQHACIDEKNQLRIVSVNVPESASCHVFNQSDLPASHQDATERFPGGSYDAVLGLLGRLANEALPVCVDKDGAEAAQPAQACREVAK